MKHIKELKLNEDHLADDRLEHARKNVEELAEYLNIDGKELVNLMLNSDSHLDNEEEEALMTLAYSYGLI